MEIEYTFDIVWIIVGIVVMALGALIFKNYNKLAELSGVGNFTRWQYAGFIVIGIGFLLMLNVPIYLLKLLVAAIMKGGV